MTSAKYPLPYGHRGHARVAIITIIQEEFQAAEKVFGLTHDIPGTSYVSGPPLGEKLYDVVLCQAIDRSLVPCATLTREVMEDFRPQYLLLVGIAGGLTEPEGGVASEDKEVQLVGREGVDLGDVVIANSVTHSEFMKITDKELSLRYFVIDHPSLHLRKNVTQVLMRRFDLASAITQIERPEPGAPKILEGQIVCGDKIMSGYKNEVQTELLKPFDKALAVEMESVGLARSVCERRTSVWYNPRYAIIRGISDMVPARENVGTRDKWKQYAAYAAANVAKEFVRRLPQEPLE